MLVWYILSQWNYVKGEKDLQVYCSRRKLSSYPSLRMLKGGGEYVQCATGPDWLIGPEGQVLNGHHWFPVEGTLALWKVTQG